MIALTSLISQLWSLLLAFLGISFIVAFHEFGHLMFAKLFGVYAPSFSIGFGPRLIEKKIGETTYCISAIPLGGYVEIAGNLELGQGSQESAHLTGDRALSSKPYWQKLLIMLGGILFNMIFAFLALSFLFYKGAPVVKPMDTINTAKPVVYSVLPQGPAALAKLQLNDTILSVNGTQTPTIDSVVQLLQTQKSSQVNLIVDRAGKHEPINLTLKEDEQKQLIPSLGVFWHTRPEGIIPALKDGWNQTISLTKEVFKAFAGIIKKRDTKNVGGPFMLISQLKNGVGLGYKLFIFLLIFISINLAVLNILPLPIFDGGQILLETIEAIMGRPLPESVRYAIHYYSWLAVLALIIYLTYNDILRIFFPGFSLKALLHSLLPSIF